MQDGRTLSMLVTQTEYPSSFYKILYSPPLHSDRRRRFSVMPCLSFYHINEKQIQYLAGTNEGNNKNRLKTLLYSFWFFIRVDNCFDIVYGILQREGCYFHFHSMSTFWQIIIPTDLMTAGGKVDR